ncbi:hypothetical protein Bbelb_007190 [Branchiostoma belcheri]|nr:hypothetical protein Bbelb_007190 [Branchiostoma belcheri]
MSNQQISHLCVSVVVGATKRRIFLKTGSDFRETIFLPLDKMVDTGQCFRREVNNYRPSNVNNRTPPPAEWHSPSHVYVLRGSLPDADFGPLQDFSLRLSLLVAGLKTLQPSKEQQ